MMNTLKAKILKTSKRAPVKDTVISLQKSPLEY
jgi:hypothetical protein